MSTDPRHPWSTGITLRAKRPKLHRVTLRSARQLLRGVQAVTERANTDTVSL